MGTLLAFGGVFERRLLVGGERSRPDGGGDREEELNENEKYYEHFGM
jgi:hypothetical protein